MAPPLVAAVVPMTEPTTADPIRARLDEHRMYRGTCLGCTRRFGGFHCGCAIQPEADALRAVLDLCENPPMGAYYEDPVSLLVDGISRAIADALGVAEGASRE